MKENMLSVQLCNLIEDNLETVYELRESMTLKKDNTPVTKADIFLEELIKDYLVLKYESLYFIGEESFESKETIFGDKEYVAVLDPIDGTENFTSGLVEWGVSFGLWKKGEFKEGFIYLPELGKKIISGEKNIEYTNSRIIGLSSSINEKFINSMIPNQQYRIMGCAVYNIYNVISGKYKEFVNPVGARIWDVLPGMNIALNQGCKVYINDEIFDSTVLPNPSKEYKIRIIR